MDPPALPADVVARVAALAEADPEREVCGLVVRPPAGDHEVVPIPNALPPREASRAFVLEPAALLSALAGAERRGATVVAVYHSHPQGGPALSARDRDGFVFDGTPAIPGALLVVVALAGRRACSAALYRWNGREFDAFPLGLPQRAPPCAPAQ